ncbi:hypothetical protein [Acetobacter aceti]|nr:hypothetical protein [Acetobacter aceti]
MTAIPWCRFHTDEIMRAKSDIFAIPTKPIVVNRNGYSIDPSTD